MLPDFPDEKAKFMAFWERYADLVREKNLGFISDIVSYSQPEGGRWQLDRNDGTSSESAYHLVSSKISLKDEEILTLNLADILKKFAELGMEMASQMSSYFYQSLREISTQTGNIVNAHGQPFNKDVFLQSIEAVGLSFDDRGQPLHPAIVMNPHLWESIKDDIAEWETDPEFVRRHEAIIVGKKEEWRVRQSNRKLVD